MSFDRPSAKAQAVEATLVHPPVALLTVELASLRRHAQHICRNHPPGPERAAQLRTLELRQRALRAQLGRELGPLTPSTARHARGGRGQLAPGWHLSF